MSIPITYFRSSSFNAHRMCPQQYFIEYCLGYKQQSNKKADKGTIVHKVLEICGGCKKAFQDGEEYFEDDVVGKVHTHNYDTQYLDDIIRKVYDYYATSTKHHAWDHTDHKSCRQWVWKALKYNDGMFDPRNRLIIAPEIRFDFELQEDWAKYKYSLPEGVLEGHLALKGTIDLITEVDTDCYEMVDWKGLPVDTPIPTINGWSTMRKLNIGDKIFDKNGNVTTILGKSQPSIKSCYKITFDDTSTVVCDCDHLWLLSTGAVVNVLELKLGDTIDTTKPLCINDCILPIDPYVLGVWLGDGRNRSGEICNPNDFIWQKIKHCGYNIGKNIGGNNKCRSSTVYGLTTQLKSLNLLHNKHIPNIYLRASFDQRLRLLQGLMDSDGNANIVRKQAVFTSCNKQLSDNVKELLYSLGQRPNQCQTTQRGFGLVVTAYPIHFRPININPFLLPYKRNKIDIHWGPGLSNKRKIINIQKTNDQTTQCIMVDSPTHTYLCTKHMIPTHNTGQRKDWATGHVKTEPLLYKDAQLRLYHLAMMNLFPGISTFMVTIFFINDGGPFTVLFEEKDIPTTLEMVRRRYDTIRKTRQPQLKRSWKCSRLCHFGKNTFRDTDIKPIIEERPYQSTTRGKQMTMCEQIKYQIAKRGINWVVENMMCTDHSINSYRNPGEVT